jgi:hypothetical protein
MKGDDLDPKGLILEAYRIDRIGPGECRSIFLDWALSLDGMAADEALPGLLARHAKDAPEHPMTAVLCEGAETAARPRGARPKRRRPETDEG